MLECGHICTQKCHTDSIENEERNKKSENLLPSTKMIVSNVYKRKFPLRTFISIRAYIQDIFNTATVNLLIYFHKSNKTSSFFVVFRIS